MTNGKQKASQHEQSSGGLFWVSPQGARIALIALHLAALVAVVIEFIFPFPADGHAVERVHALDFPASYAIYGFVSCVILVLLGIVLRRLVKRPEHYYEDEQQ